MKKIIVLLLVLLGVVLLVQSSFAAYTSSPADLVHCTVSPVNNAVSYGGAVLWYWRCWTVDDLYHYVKQSWITKGGSAYYASLQGRETWYVKLLSPALAEAFAYDNKGRAVLTFAAGMAEADDQADAIRESVMAQCGNDCVLVEDVANSDAYIKYISEYTEGLQSSTCDSNNYCGGTNVHISSTWDGSQWVRVIQCNNAGGTSCANKRSFCKVTFTVEGARVYAGGSQTTGHGSYTFGSPSQAEVAAFCTTEDQSNNAVNGDKVGAKAVDDATMREGMSKAMVQDALKGSTITDGVETGVVSATGGAGSRGIGSTSEGASAGAAETGDTGGANLSLPSVPTFQGADSGDNPTKMSLITTITGFIANHPLVALVSASEVTASGTCGGSAAVAGGVVWINFEDEGSQALFSMMGSLLLVASSIMSFFIMFGRS